MIRNMKTVGLFEAKTKLSEICEEVARSKRPIVISRRGKPLVQIMPAQAADESTTGSMLDDLRKWDADHPGDEGTDFELPPRNQADRSPLENYWE